MVAGIEATRASDREAASKVAHADTSSARTSALTLSRRASAANIRPVGRARGSCCRSNHGMPMLTLNVSSRSGHNAVSELAVGVPLNAPGSHRIDLGQSEGHPVGPARQVRLLTHCESASDRRKRNRQRSGDLLAFWQVFGRTASCS
jgi:hypothetical protein